MDCILFEEIKFTLCSIIENKVNDNLRKRIYILQMYFNLAQESPFKYFKKILEQSDGNSSLNQLISISKNDSQSKKNDLWTQDDKLSRINSQSLNKTYAEDKIIPINLNLNKRKKDLIASDDKDENMDDNISINYSPLNDQDYNVMNQNGNNEINSHTYKLSSDIGEDMESVKAELQNQNLNLQKIEVNSIDLDKSSNNYNEFNLDVSMDEGFENINNNKLKIIREKDNNGTISTTKHSNVIRLSSNDENCSNKQSFKKNYYNLTEEGSKVKTN